MTKPRKKCPHNKCKSRCRICSPNTYCIHDTRKANCRICKGSNICFHNKHKQVCSICSPHLFCEHDTPKSRCCVCNPKLACVHNKRKSRCRVCTPEIVCEHNNIGNNCSRCGTRKRCPHNKCKLRCRICSPNMFCIHENQKSNCSKCENVKKCPHNQLKKSCRICSPYVCIHGKLKYHCQPCGSKRYCIHKKLKSHCKICPGGGQNLCKTLYCETTGNKKYKGYCMFCYMNLFPDSVVYRNYKTKENHVIAEILELYPDHEWIRDKKIQDGCSRRRPDLLLNLGTYAIIIEVDENQHSDYDIICENKRLMEISQDLNHIPIVVIRFNPDKYIKSNGKKVPSCFRLNQLGISVINKTEYEQWNWRIECLRFEIKYWMIYPPERTINISNMFYSN